MRFRHIALSIIVAGLVSSHGFSKGRATKPIKRTPARAAESASPAPASEPVVIPPVQAVHPPPKYQLNPLFGISVVQGTALTLGGQLGYSPFRPLSLFMGPSVMFGNFGTGSLLQALWGVWWRFVLSNDIGLFLHVGTLFGASIPLENYAVSSAFTWGAEIAFESRLDELSVIRLAFRPLSLINGVSALFVGLGVGFRFF